MFINNVSAEQTFGDFVKVFCKDANNARITTELELLDKIIESDILDDSILLDHIIAFREALRDECVERVRIASGKMRD